MDDVVHGGQLQVRADLAQQFLGRATERAGRRAGDDMERIARRAQTELDGAGKLAIQHEKLGDPARRNPAMPFAVHLEGRGGAQHKAIQKRIKEAAEKLGFRGIIEKPVLEGQGSVDLWLERVGQSIACEISISTTIDHEVGNVAKCLKAGLPKVAVICLDEERLRKISKAVSGSLGAESAARVEYFQPDPFIAYLTALQPVAPQPSETRYGGYKVKRSTPKLSAPEQKQKEDIANRIMAETMRRK